MGYLLEALRHYFVTPILNLFLAALVAYVVLGWLLLANVLDNRNPTVRSIYSFLFQIIEPVARPVRRIVPPIGNLDLSVLLIALTIPFLNREVLPFLIQLISFS